VAIKQLLVLNHFGWERWYSDTNKQRYPRAQRIFDRTLRETIRLEIKGRNVGFPVEIRGMNNNVFLGARRLEEHKGFITSLRARRFIRGSIRGCRCIAPTKRT
jgi:hypothetical protein